MIWSIVQTIGKRGITFLVFAILASLLNPTDFGILGMALAWVTFIQAFSEIGFGAALIQSQNVSSKHFSTTFFINVALGLILTLLGVLLSWPCAIFFKTPEVQPIMAVLSFGFLINSFSLTQMVILQKELRFRDLAMRDISASFVGGVAGIICALLKFGTWSLIIQVLTTYVLGTILIWYISRWRPRVKEFSFHCVRELWPYSSKILAFNIFKYFAQNIDRLIIGYFLGSIALGVYTFAYNLVMLPVSTLVGAMGVYLFPKYSAMQENLQSINKSYLFVVKTISSAVMPVMVIVAFLSPIIIPFIWGTKWIQAVPLIQIFSVFAIIGAFVSPVGQLMKALNRPGWLFNWSVFITTVVFICMFLGIQYKGIIGAGLGITIAYALGVPIIYFIIHKLIRIGLRDIFDSMFPSILSGLLMGLLLLGILNSRIFLNDSQVFVGIFSGTLLYLICLIMFDKPFIITIYRRFVKVWNMGVIT